MESIGNTPEKTSGYHDSYWTDSAPSIQFGRLTKTLETDVVVVGAGIAGLSVAYNVAKTGFRVVVLEDGEVGSGESGRTTAHLVNALDDRYIEIEKTFGEAKSRLAAESHTAAIQFIEEVVREESIDCDFERVNGYLFLDPTDKISTLQDEFEATRKAGIPVELLSAVPDLAHYEGPCIRFPGQAQFHPMKYLAGLCRAIVSAGGEIYTRTKVTDIRKDGVTANGLTVSARHIVVATNTPVNDRVTMHTKQYPYRTYVVAAEIPVGSVERALWWDTGTAYSPWVTKPYHYVRTQPFNATSDLLIVGGEDHKTGQAHVEDIPEQDRYTRLEQWARRHFPMITNIAYTWSGQVMEPVDMIGFIGRNPGDHNIYIATGDSGNGMTHGTIAGLLISELISGKHHAWEKLYDPSRITFKAAGDFIKEASNMASQYLDYLTPGDAVTWRELKAEEGAIIRFGPKKIAVFKDAHQKIHAYSAVCSHLGCYVHWNADEKSFDCPCHGSRFSVEGKVLNGPALTGLHPVEIRSRETNKVVE